MKKTIYFLLSFMLLMASCNSEKQIFTLQGQLEGLESDTLLVYYQVPEYRLDTIYAQKGTFEYTFTPDTLTVFSLVLNAEESIPVVADKGGHVEVSRKEGKFTIQGEGDNKLMDKILKLMEGTSATSIHDKVDSIIQNNPQSFTSLYLIDKYYANDSLPDYERIENIISKLSGIIKDTPYIMELQTKIGNLSEKGKTTSIHTLYNKGKDSKDIRWSSIKNKYILLDFWASWHPESVAAQDSLAAVVKALKKEDFLAVSVSLDMDRDAWLKASERDTTQWKQVCDFKGWNNSTVRSQSIHSLPSNILLDKNKRIIARNIRGQELTDKVRQLLKRDKEMALKRKK